MFHCFPLFWKQGDIWPQSNLSEHMWSEQSRVEENSVGRDTEEYLVHFWYGLVLNGEEHGVV